MSRSLSVTIKEYVGYSGSVLGYSENTIKVKICTLQLFLQFIGDKELSVVTQEDILSFAEFISKRRGRCGLCSISTRATRMGNLKSFFRWCENIRGYKVLNWRLIPIPHYERNRIHYLDHKEYNRVISSIKTSKFEGLRLRAYIEVSLSTGCRANEMLNMRLNDVNWEQSEIVVKGKGSKFRAVFLNTQSRFWLEKYLESRNDTNPYLWVIRSKDIDKMTDKVLWYSFKQLRERTGIGWLTPHVLRHTFATCLLHNGANIRQVQMLMGHKSLESTMVYTHYSDDGLKNCHAQFLKI